MLHVLLRTAGALGNVINQAAFGHVCEVSLSSENLGCDDASAPQPELHVMVPRRKSLIFRQRRLRCLLSPCKAAHMPFSPPAGNLCTQ
jgi:hypothetical protein